MSSKAHILIVDDDPEIISFLKRGLIYEGYSVATAADGAGALNSARENEPDLVILDVMMPGIDGIETSKRLRKASNIPILMLTAKGTVSDRVAGLDSGADDYLVKPFAFDELVARIRALLRRANPEEEEIIRFNELSMNLGSREVTIGNEIINLTPLEFNLLELFLRHPRQVLTRDQIFEKVWGYDFGGESNVIDVYIRYLRSKIESNNHPRLLHTIRGVGYVLKDN